MTDFDPALPAAAALLDQLGVKDLAAAGRMIAAIDGARTSAGWVIVRTIPCPHVDIRVRTDPNDPLRYCAQCGEDMPLNEPGLAHRR